MLLISKFGTSNCYIRTLLVVGDTTLRLCNTTFIAVYSLNNSWVLITSSFLHETLSPADCIEIDEKIICSPEMRDKMWLQTQKETVLFGSFPFPMVDIHRPTDEQHSFEELCASVNQKNVLTPYELNMSLLRPLPTISACSFIYSVSHIYASNIAAFVITTGIVQLWFQTHSHNYTAFLVFEPVKAFSNTAFTYFLWQKLEVCISLLYKANRNGGGGGGGVGSGVDGDVELSLRDTVTW